jgi:hypothetical protein
MLNLLRSILALIAVFAEAIGLYQNWQAAI